MRYGREISGRNTRTQESYNHTQAVRSFLYGTQERVYESLGKTTLIFCSSIACIVMIDEQGKAKKSSMPHKKKKIIDEIRSMILDLLKLWGIYDIISY